MFVMVWIRYAINLTVVIFASYIVIACGQTIDLGTAATYAVIGATIITNTGPSDPDLDIAVCSGNSIARFPPGVVVGTESVGEPIAEAEQPTQLMHSIKQPRCRVEPVSRDKILEERFSVLVSTVSDLLAHLQAI